MIQTITDFMKLVTALIRPFKNYVIGVSAVLFIWLFLFNWTSYHEITVERNFFTSELRVDTTAGMNFTFPWVQVVSIDTRPRNLCVECNCKTLNCVLVQFNKDYAIEFIEREGFRYYWLDNRLSFNSGANREYRGLDYVFRGYAFDAQRQPFMNLIKD